MSTMTNDCLECGRPFAKTRDQYVADVEEKTCGLRVASDMPMAEHGCRHKTVARLKARVAELEKMFTEPRLRVWELAGGDVWCVARAEEECWGYLEDQHGNTDEITELKEEGSGWTALPDDKKISLYVDSDGDVCGYDDDGAPCNMPCWVWAVRHGAGFLGETE